MGQPSYRNGFQLTLHGHLLDLPLGWRKPRMVFVNSMSDLFHEDVPTEFIMKVFDVMLRAERHTFQVLTKRSERLAELSPVLPWASNIWMGVTVESSAYLNRIDDLRGTGAKLKFLSLEPLLSAMPNLDLTGIDWVIVGGESGTGARAMEKDWVMDIRDQCLSMKVPFFFKQWGGVNKKKAGRELGGRIWDQMPVTHNRQTDLAAGDQEP
jgi:protein gp37